MALRRIEAAIARLEAAARQPRRAPPADPAPESGQLEASNVRLRDAVSLSLRRIDALIAEHGADPQP